MQITLKVQISDTPSHDRGMNLDELGHNKLLSFTLQLDGGTCQKKGCCSRDVKTSCQAAMSCTSALMVEAAACVSRQASLLVSLGEPVRGGDDVALERSRTRSTVLLASSAIAVHASSDALHFHSYFFCIRHLVTVWGHFPGFCCRTRTAFEWADDWFRTNRCTCRVERNDCSRGRRLSK